MECVATTKGIGNILPVSSLLPVLSFKIHERSPGIQNYELSEIIKISRNLPKNIKRAFSKRVILMVC